jgi:hypothetical protein
VRKIAELTVSEHQVTNCLNDGVGVTLLMPAASIGAFRVVDRVELLVSEGWTGNKLSINYSSRQTARYLSFVEEWLSMVLQRFVMSRVTPWGYRQAVRGTSFPNSS